MTQDYKSPEEYSPIKIEVTDSEGQKISLTTHWDSDIEAWKEVFTTVLTFLTFSPQTIKELFYDEEDEQDEGDIA